MKLPMNNVLKAVASIFVDNPLRAQGPDLAHWEKWFDPTKASERIDFVIQKITEGTTWVDPLINDIWRGVRQVGVRGAYHYQRSGLSWEAQARHFLFVAGKFDYHFHALDMEEINNTINDAYFSDARRIIDHWRNAVPSKKAILYTNWSLYIKFYAAIVRLYPDGREWLDGLDFWYAWPSRFLNEPILPSVRKTWTFWQKSWVGSAAEWGTGSNTDVNYFNGTQADLAKWASVTFEPTPTPEPPPLPPPIIVEPEPLPETWRATVTVNDLNIRKYPVVIDGTKTGHQVDNGETFVGRLWVGNGYVWMLIDQAIRTELIGKWVAVRTEGWPASGDQFIRLERVPAGEIPTVPVPYRPLYQVLFDWQRSDFTGTITRPNMPCVFRLGELENSNNGHYTQLTAAWQFFLADLIAMSVYGRAYGSLSRVEKVYIAKRTTAIYSDDRFITNNKGMDVYRNYLLDERMEKELPAIYTLVCGGASLAGEIVTNSRGAPMLKVEHFDGTKPPPPIDSIDWRNDPRVFFANSITGTRKEDGYAVYRFPQLAGRDVPIPIVASRDVYFPLAFTRLLADGKKGYPYYPVV